MRVDRILLAVLWVVRRSYDKSVIRKYEHKLPKAGALVNRLEHYVRQLAAAAERDAVAPTPAHTSRTCLELIQSRSVRSSSGHFDQTADPQAVRARLDFPVCCTYTCAT